MKKTTLLIIHFLCLICLLFSSISVEDGRAEQIFKAIVTKTIDGDSIQIRDGRKVVEVRLWGIDTPEWKQPYSKVAKSYTDKMVSGKQVTLRVKDWDKYGRMVAIVTTEQGGCLNEELIKEGFAWVHIYYCKEQICEKWRLFEKNAKNNRLGLWQERSPVPPWVWKQKNRK